MKFSANLGFLWKELPLAQSIRAAKAAGFDAVECHWPYNESVSEISDALAETDLKLLSINTSPGDVSAHEFGLSALCNKTSKARNAIDEALRFANATDTQNIHVMAGKASCELARETFMQNLKYACEEASSINKTILIEPLNHLDVPGYFFSRTQEAESIINDVAMPNLKLMFDCYHVHQMGENILERLEQLLPIIGHIQFASAPYRGEPSNGEINYKQVFNHIAQLGYDAPLGAEYRPQGKTEDSLDWLSLFQSIEA